MMNDYRRNARPYPASRQPARRPARRFSALKRAFAQRPKPVWLVIALDVIAIGIALLVFALFHHVLPAKEKAVGITSQRSVATVQLEATQNPTEIAPAATDNQLASMETADQLAVESAEQTQEPAAALDPEGYFGNKYADKFTSGEVVQNESGYRSSNLNITYSTMREYDAQVYLVDFYLKDITFLRAAFANDTFGRGQREHLLDVAAREGSVVAINGDYYGGHGEGIVIRNGMLYRNNESLEMDIGVIYWDGTMKTFSPDEFNAETEIANGAYQAWSFGPELLDENSQAMTTFNTKVNPKNPRTAIGYFEPGHYCFVVVDGRSKSSAGMTMVELSEFMCKLGCKVAYNLDGGASTELVIGTQRVNSPYNDGRACTDAVVLVDGV